jgi:hypothetical protein
MGMSMAHRPFLGECWPVRRRESWRWILTYRSQKVAMQPWSQRRPMDSSEPEARAEKCDIGEPRRGVLGD